jgi:DNA mismatch repair protein MutS2
VPGASSALIVARRFGMPETVIDLARRVLPEQSKTFDDLVRGLESERRTVEITRRELESERREASVARHALENELARLRSDAHKRIDRETERLLEVVRKARDEIRDRRQAIREAADEDALRLARVEIELAAAVANEARARVVPKEHDADFGEAIASPRVGERVFLATLRKDGEVLEGPTRGRVRVAAGAMRLWVDVADLRKPRTVKEERSKRRPATPEARATTAASVLTTSDNTIDLRGMRVEDALAMLEAFLDRLYGASIASAYVLHGVGTGALRDAVREWLKRDGTYVRGFRTGGAEEGGDRLTVVELA